MSKMVKCKSCGKEISKNVKCPHCGKDNRNFFIKHKVLTIICGIVVLIGIGTGIETNDNKITKVNNDKQTNTKQQEFRNFNVGDTAEKSDSYRITVTNISEYKSSNEFIQAPEGKKYIIANVEIENLSKDNDIIVSSIACFNLLGLDGTKYDFAITDADSILDGTIAPGRNLKGNVTFEVPNDLTEAELEVNLDIFTGKTIYFKGNIN